MSDVTLKKALYLATVLENINKHEDAMKCMEEIVKSKKNDLSIEEINLFSITYGNFIKKKQNQIKVLNKVISNDEKTNSKFKKIDTNLREVIKREIGEICNKVINFCDNYLLNKSEKKETKVLYLKIKAEFYRTLADILEENQKKDSTEKAINFYKEAYELTDSLSTTNPIKLGLSLYYAIFHYEFLDDVENALKICQENFELGIHQLDKVNDNQEYKSASSILMLMKENIDMWKKEIESNNEE